MRSDDDARAQLPASMQDCTIVFNECERGHGWLTAANWVQHGCPTCEVERAARWFFDVGQKSGQQAHPATGMLAETFAAAWSRYQQERSSCSS